MLGQDRFEASFVIFAFAMQVVLVIFFAARKWAFASAMQFGWLVYALGIPALLLSIVLLVNGKAWTFWLGGFLFAAWAVFGYSVDIARPVAWRGPIVWPVFIPYVLLYTASLMFYWWPLGLMGRPQWLAYGLLFVISTALNISSHAR